MSYWSKFLFIGIFLFSFTTAAQERIVSLKPNLTEILFALGVGDKIVGATSYCQRPEAAKKIPRVADYIHVNTEKVLRLQPDLVLGSQENSRAKEIHFLQNQGLSVHLFSFQTIEQITQSLFQLGQLLHREPQADKLIKQMKTDLAQLKQKAQQVSPKRALFVVGHRPLVVAGGNNFFNDAAKYLGVVNVAAKSKIAYPTYSTERLIRSHPEVIIDLVMGSEQQKESFAIRKKWWQQFSTLPAVKQNKVLAFDIEKMRAAPSLPQSLQELFELIHQK